MEIEQFEILEKKVNDAVKLIEHLKRENQRLTDENLDMRNESRSKELQIQQLKEENQTLRETQAENSIGKEKEEEVRDKVEQMLKKLDELESNL